MPFIRESIVVTVMADGSPHAAPLGVIEEGEHLVLAPFMPSRTLDNLRREGRAVVNYVTDPRLFAGLVSGRRRDWPFAALPEGGFKLAAALAHEVIEVVRCDEDEARPRFSCRSLGTRMHAPFLGMNRAQAAIVEAAILCTRLHMLPEEKVDRELAYLAIAIEKTAGPAEREAWEWLTAMVERQREGEDLA